MLTQIGDLRSCIPDTQLLSLSIKAGTHFPFTFLALTWQSERDDLDLCTFTDVQNVNLNFTNFLWYAVISSIAYASNVVKLCNTL